MTMMGKNTRFFWVILLDKKQLAEKRAIGGPPHMLLNATDYCP